MRSLLFGVTARGVGRGGCRDDRAFRGSFGSVVRPPSAKHRSSARRWPRAAFSRCTGFCSSDCRSAPTPTSSCTDAWHRTTGSIVTAQGVSPTGTTTGTSTAIPPSKAKDATNSGDLITQPSYSIADPAPMATKRQPPGGNFWSGMPSIGYPSAGSSCGTRGIGPTDGCAYRPCLDPFRPGPQTE